MRIYLTHGAEQNDVMPNYEYVDYTHIEGAAYPAQVDEIYGPIILNYIPLLEVMGFVAKVRKLLRVGGQLVIGGIDCYLLSKATLDRNITEKEYNNLLFVDPKFKAIHSLQAIKGVLQSSGFSIDEIYLEEDEVRFCIKASKA